MTKDEVRFYLREIHPYWTPPRISTEKIAELEQQKLVERSVVSVPVIRLTHEGAREKAAGQQRKSNSRLKLVRTPKHRPKVRREVSETRRRLD